jgi:hypothetical protein
VALTSKGQEGVRSQGAVFVTNRSLKPGNTKSNKIGIDIPILGIELDGYDKAVKENPQYVTEFIKDIEKHLKAVEVSIAVVNLYSQLIFLNLAILAFKSTSMRK